MLNVKQGREYVQAPVGVMALVIRGNVRPRTPAFDVLVIITLMRFWILTKGVVDADSPGHTLLTLDGGEYFGRVLEGDGTFTEGVGDGKEVHEADRLVSES
jgi:hypothetical protein